MKTILTLALLTALNLTAGEVPVDAPKPEGQKQIGGSGESKEGYRTATPSAPKMSTRGSVATSAVISTARPTVTRTASVSRVNLRRPTKTTTTVAPAGGSTNVL